MARGSAAATAPPVPAGAGTEAGRAGREEQGEQEQERQGSF